MKLFYHYPFYFRLKRGFSSIPVVKTAYFPNKQKVAAFSINRGGTHEENRSGYDRSPREPKKGTRKSKKEKKRRLRQPAFTPELDTGDTGHGEKAVGMDLAPPRPFPDLPSPVISGNRSSSNSPARHSPRPPKQDTWAYESGRIRYPGTRLSDYPAIGRQARRANIRGPFPPTRNTRNPLRTNQLLEDFAASYRERNSDSLRTARPRCETAFFSSALISAKVRS